MKFVIGSDIHGAADWCQKFMKVIQDEKPDRVLLLGDLLYHGPRNDLPADYAPKRVIEMLNGISNQVIAVRGNCEAEVDQMVLDFPCMSDHNVVIDPDVLGDTGNITFTLFLTHGHIYGPGLHNSVDRWPTLPEHSALVYGHTHKKVNEVLPNHPGVIVFNPGSVGIPKDGTHSCGVYENGQFRHIILS